MSARDRVVKAAGAASGITAAGAARLAYTAMSRRPPGGPKAWLRTNHRGEPVTLLEGPAVAAGAIAGALAQAGLVSMAGSPGWRAGTATAVAGAGGAAFGAYDDLAGSADRRGFRGHLGALRHGELTTGAVKLGGIGITGILSAALVGGTAADVVINAGLVAGGANLLNLFDLRPGRAIKVTAASGALITAGGALSSGSAVPVAAGLALLPEDLGERAMLGDCGANALGAMLGAAAAAGLPRPARIALLAGIAGLTAASEKVSFTRVIERTPALRWLDMLGRRQRGTGGRAALPKGGQVDLGGWHSSRGGSGGMGFSQGESGGMGFSQGESGGMGLSQGESGGMGPPRKRKNREGLGGIVPPGLTRFAGAGTTARSAENTDQAPPGE